MGKPIVAIVGRPNVGKSTLFNIFANSRISIVEDTPGVTRDRLYAEGDWLDNQFMMVDTGGIEIMNSDAIAVSIRQQAEIATLFCLCAMRAAALCRRTPTLPEFCAKAASRLCWL